MNSTVLPRWRASFLLWMLAFLCGCAGPQSTLDVAGADAAEIADLFWWMAGAAVVVWLAVTSLALYCARGPRHTGALRAAPWLIVGGGVALPVVVLVPLLAFSLPSLDRMVGSSSSTPLVIDVSGEQWWWRVRYVDSGGVIELANEIRLPVDLSTSIRLTSDNVIHSFWIPSLAGKVDMIPGRTTHLSLKPLETGTFRGVCAEYCGTAHALMAFPVVVLERGEFDEWLSKQADPARHPVDALEVRGQQLFDATGCGACHAIRGTTARGTIGPDLTHLGARLSLAAGTLANTPNGLATWISHTTRTKPGAEMPPFDMLSAADIAAMAAYIGSLK